MFKKLLLSLLAIFGLSLVLAGDTFAKDDISVPVSNAFTQVCSSDTAVTGGFCGYNYFIVSLDSRTTDIICRAYDSSGTQVGNSAQYPTRSSTYLVLNNISFDGLSYNSISCRAMTPTTGSFTLTDKQPSFPTGSISITENGTFDVSNYAEAVVNVPEAECEDCDDNFIVSAFKTIFVNFAVSIIPVCAIVFVVWFMIDMITSFVYGRGR